MVALLAKQSKRPCLQRPSRRGGDEPFQERACPHAIPGVEVMIGRQQLSAAPVFRSVSGRRRARPLEQPRCRLGCATAACFRPRLLEGPSNPLVRLGRGEREVLRALLEIVHHGREVAMDGSALVRRGSRVDGRSEERMRERDRAVWLPPDDFCLLDRSERIVEKVAFRLRKRSGCEESGPRLRR